MASKNDLHPVVTRIAAFAGLMIAGLLVILALALLVAGISWVWRITLATMGGC